MSLSQIITQEIASYLDALQKRLIDSGLDEQKVNEAFKKPAEQPKKKGFDKVHIVLNYGKSHAVFGDFGGSLSHIRKDYFLKLKWIKYNKNLAYGSGWTLLNPKKLPELEKIFTKEGVEYVKLSRSEFDKKYREIFPSRPDISGESSDECSSSKSDSEKTGSIFSEPRKRTVRKNKWKNYQDKSTGFIFKEINPKEWIVIGKQDKTLHRSVVGLDSVIKLSEEDELQCKEYKWEYLTIDTKIKNKKLAKRLQKIIASKSPVYYEFHIKLSGDDTILVIVQFKSEEHYTNLADDMFDKMGPMFNEYFDTIYQEEMIVDEVVECVRKLEKPPSDDDYMVVE